MSYDELELDRMGDRRTATFFCISDTDSTYNFLVALAFSQMFNLLCERADNVHGGRLPHHVRVFIVSRSVAVSSILFSNLGSTKGLMSFSFPQRAVPYSASRRNFFAFFALQ